MRSEKARILVNVFGSYIERGDELLFSCPYCDHRKKKFSVNIEKGYYKCWVCDERGRNVSRAIRKFGNFSHFREWQEITGKVNLNDFDKIFSEEEEKVETIISLPAEFKSLANNYLPPQAKPFLSYLSNRGVTREEIVKWKIGYCTEGEYKNRVIIPSFNEDGQVTYFIARTIVGDWKKYKNPPVSKDIIFNDLYVDWEEDIVLVEGVFDAINAGNSVPILGSTLREDSKLFKKILSSGVKVYTGLDSDAKEKELKIIKMLMSYGVEVSKIDTTGFEDIGEMNSRAFRDRLGNADSMDSEQHLIHKIMSI